MKYYFDSELIVREVQKYKYIYDFENSDFHNRQLGRPAWLAVAKAVVGTEWDQMDENTKDEVAKEVRRRWRSSFLRSLKKAVDTGGGIEQFKGSCMYDKDMNFLRAVYEQKENFEKSLAENSTSMKHEPLQGRDDMTGIVEGECEVDLIEPSTSPTKQQQALIKRLKNDRRSSIENIFQRKLLEPSKPETVHDMTGNAEKECEVIPSPTPTKCQNCHPVVFNDGNPRVVPTKLSKKGHFSSMENVFQRTLLESSKPETVQDVAGDTEKDCEVILSDCSPTPTKHQLADFNDGTPQVVPTKRLKTYTEDAVEWKLLQSSKPQTVHAVTRNGKEDCEVMLSDSSPSTTKRHLVVFNDGTPQAVPAKRLKIDNTSSTENIVIRKLLQSSKPVPEDSNELFLRSLMLDMSKLNPDKLRHFKTFVMTKLTSLLDEQDAESVRDLTDGLANAYILESFSIES